jgi:rubredoxin
MKKFRCRVCGYIYDEAIGDASLGIAPGTLFEELPKKWVCPACQANKSYFDVVDESTPLN